MSDHTAHDEPIEHDGGGSADDDPDAGSTLYIGIVGAIILIVVTVALQGLFEQTSQAEFARKVLSAAPQELRDLEAAQLEILNGYRWVDSKSGVTGIPIERAMDLVVAERKASPAKP